MRTTGVVLDVLIALVIIFCFAIKFYAVQTYLARQLASYMSSELNAQVSIEGLEIDLMRRVELKGLFIKDLKGDTLLYAPKAKCLLQNYSIRKRVINFSEISLEKPRIKLAKYKGEKDLNFEFIADYFDDGKKSNSKSRPWKLNIKRVKVRRANFSMDNYNKSYRKFGVDFDHLGLYPLNVNLSEFSNYGDTSSVLVRNLAFHEKSGFVVDTLNTKVKITPTSLLLSPLKIKTPNSNIKAGYLAFGYKDFDDFDDFEDKIMLSANFAKSQLNLGDLSYFVSELKGSTQNVALNGSLKGTVNNFEAKQMTFAYSTNTFLKGDFKIKNITDTDIAEFDLNIKKLKASGKELAAFEVPPYDGKTFIDIPQEVKNLGDIDYIGTFKGSLNDFYSKGSLLSSIGLVATDINYKKDLATNIYKIKGQVTTQEFDAGTFLGDNTIGKVTSDVEVDIYGKDFEKNMHLNMRANLQTITFNDYTYHNCNVDGKIKNETFIGKLNIDDQNLQLAYNGYFNYGKKIPEYDFTARIHNAAITKLNFGNRDQDALLSMNVRMTGKGIKPDDLRGNIVLTNIDFCEKDKSYEFKDISVKAEEFADKSKKITVRSEVLDADVEGMFNFAEIPNVFISITSKAIPSLFDNKVLKVKTNELFTYKVTVKDFTKIQELFIPDLQVSKNAVIDGRFDSKQDIFRFTAKNIKKLKFGDQYFEDLKITAKNNDDFINTQIRAENFQVNDSISFQNLEIETMASNNNVQSEMVWKNANGNAGDLHFLGSILSHNEFNFTLQPSKVKIKQGEWVTERDARIEIDSSRIEIMDFDARSGIQSISVNGIVAENNTDQLIASLCNFKLETITPLLLGSDLEFKGDINGNIVVSSIYHKPNFVNSISVDSFYVNKEWVGDIEAINLYERGSDRIWSSAKILRKDIPNLTVTGNYYLDKKEDNLDYRFEFKETNLRFINGFLPQEDVSNFQCLADGDVTLTGTPEAPMFKGNLGVHHGSVKINMLNTSYFIEKGQLIFDPEFIGLNQVFITDVRGNIGRVNGTYNHENFENGNYSFDVEYENMLCLNTTEEMNDLYYGKAYASGIATVEGDGDNINVEIDATTKKNTKLTMPMYGVSDVTVGDFVVFVTDSVVKEKQINLDGVTLKFALDVTPDAEINIVFDKLTGQQLKARGAGNINMEITPLGDFKMDGEYEIDDPSTYKLAMQTIINKNFTVAKGGKIRWTGDPLNADIDITALYKLQANVFDIMPIDIQSKYRKNVDVNVQIQLKNSLYKPDFVFDFTVPKADENVKAAIASVKNTREELFRQTMSLLIINKFLTPSNAIGTNTQSSGNIAANYTSELITNQLNALLSQISKDVDIGVNYKPGDEISKQEIALALSTQALNGRVNISTNVGVSTGTGSTSSNQSSLIGDFNIEYLISEEGDLRVRGYNESNDFDITNSQQAPYTQGVGLYYQKEFDNSKELRLLQKFLNIFRREEKDWKDQKKKKKPKDESADTNKEAVGKE